VRAWDGSLAEKAAATPLLDGHSLAARLRHEAVFVAHSRALPAGGAPALGGKKVWTSGTKSWFALAAQGVWVQGCSESLGAEAAAQFVAEPVLRLPPPREWDVLTHAAASEPWQAGSWTGANVIATYQVSESELPERDALVSATHLFWSSTAQFERGRNFTNDAAWHASGPGKTAEHIRSSGVRNFLAFPSAEEWRKWTARAP
jgi:hydroxymethylbilane synthase